MPITQAPISVLMVSRDRTLFDTGSKTRERIAGYGALFKELHLVVFNHGAPSHDTEQIAPNVWVHPTNAASRIEQMFRAVRVGSKIQGVDIVSAQDPFEAGIAARHIARRLNAKLHIQIHADFLNPAFQNESFLNRLRGKMAKGLLPRADGIRVVSNRIKESLKGIKLKAEPVVLPIFVPVERMTETAPSFNLHEKYPQFKFILLMVARLEREKNIPLALRALAKALHTYQHMGLVVVGEGSLKNALHEEITALGIQQHVVFPGWITGHQELAAYYKTADAFLLTSRHEGFAQVLVEAAAAELPIISTDVGIASEFFADQESILLAPQDDTDAIASHLVTLLNNNQKRKMLGLDARARVMAIFPSEEDYLLLFQQSITQCLTPQKQGQV